MLLPRKDGWEALAALCILTMPTPAKPSCLCLHLYPLLERAWLLHLCARPSAGVATALGLPGHHGF